MILLLFFEEEYTSARKIPLTLQLGGNDVAGPQKKTPMVLVGVVPPPHPHPYSKERYTSFKLLVPMLCRVHRVMGSISFFRWNLNFLDAVSFPWKKFSPSKKGITPSVVLLGKIHSLRRIFVPAGIFLYYTGSALCKVYPFFVAGKLLIS